MRRVVLAFALAAFLLGSKPAHSAQYTFVDLTITGSLYTLTEAVNNAGLVGGAHWPDGTQGYGFTYQGGSYTYPSPGYQNSWKFSGINNNGLMVGTYTGGVTQSFLKDGDSYSNIVIMLWYPNPEHPDQPILGPTGTLVNGINDDGVMVGYYGSYNGYSYSFLINGPGTYYGPPSQDFTSFSAPGYLSTFADDINNSGQIVGYVQPEADSVLGFVKDGDNYTIVRAPYEGYYGQSGTATQLTGINNHGQAVGLAAVSVPYETAQYINFVYDLQTGSFTPIELVNFQGKDAMVWDINDLGQVVGYYKDNSGIYHGFLATPLPLPSTLILLGSALLPLAGLARRRPKS